MGGGPSADMTEGHRNYWAEHGTPNIDCFGPGFDAGWKRYVLSSDSAIPYPSPLLRPSIPMRLLPTRRPAQTTLYLYPY
jgi:hypothetical protein